LSYVRINKYFIHVPYLFLALIEATLHVVALWLGDYIVHTMAREPFDYSQVGWVEAIIFVLTLSGSSMAMGVYPALATEGRINILLRTLVSYFLLASIILIGYDYLTGEVYFGQKLIFWAVVLATLFSTIARWSFVHLVNISNLKRRVIILGAGNKAAKLVEDLTPLLKGLSIHIFGCIKNNQEDVVVTTVPVMPVPIDWVGFVRANSITEIVIAPDERRRSGGNSFPLSNLLDCKLIGVPSNDVIGFYERELGRIEVGLLHPSWMLFSDGFRSSRAGRFSKRLFDIAVASLFVLLLWPFMLLTALMVKLESPGPALYHQVRVGLHGRPFRIYKFRSMRQDAEKNGAKWATKNDSRITRIGAFIRNTRLDELPQIYNVLAGHMSFVGPRPERPEFVKDLIEQIPFYDMRHKVKPGLMGWAQLKYPYGASVEDARNKLQYDLYYTKNHSFMMDVLIMIQTVEIVLLGKGVH
jgi:sugar transferase (PEP-CTERM system associated)